MKKKKMRPRKLIDTAKNILLYLLVATLLTLNIAISTSSASATALEEIDSESAEQESHTNEDTDRNTENETDAPDDETDEVTPYQFDSIAQSAFLMEASTGKVLYEKDADLALPPASITKIMTLLLAFEALERGDVAWDDMVTISERAWQVEGSTMFLEVDTQVSLEDIITGISVVSANDGCVALAEHMYGSVEAFVQQMNKRAQELGMSRTQFQNPHGLPAEPADSHYMSAKDIAVLARHLIVNHPKILEIESMTDFTFNDIPQKNRNPLLGVYPGADGLKTGWTTEAGYCLVGTAEQDEMRLISVVLRTENDAERLAASRELLDYGYHNFESSEVVKMDDTVGEAAVKNGKDLTVPVKANESIIVVTEKGKIDTAQFQLVMDDEIILAPVQTGTQVGKVEIRIDGELLASAEVSTARDIEKAGFFEIIWRGITNFFKSLFKVSTEG